MDDSVREELNRKLEQLQLEHRDLDEIIHRLLEDSSADQLMLSRIKKRKLGLKDMITKLKSKLIPDIEA